MPTDLKQEFRRGLHCSTVLYQREQLNGRYVLGRDDCGKTASKSHNKYSTVLSTGGSP